jgi:hypothetical protein
MKPFDRLAPILSFLLPGLGQLRQREPAIALGFFAAFTAGHLAGWRLVVPLVAGAASFDAWRRQRAGAREIGEGTDSRKETGRAFAYLAVGSLGFLAWFALVAPAFLPVGIQMDINDQVDKLVREVRACARKQGSIPRSWEECRTDGAPRDPWGRPWALGPQGEGFELRSGGPDGELGNGDDFVYRYRR